MKEVYDESYEEYLEFLHEARMTIKNSSYEKVKKNRLYKEVLEDKYKVSLKERYAFLNAINQPDPD